MLLPQGQSLQFANDPNPRAFQTVVSPLPWNPNLSFQPNRCRLPIAMHCSMSYPKKMLGLICAN